MIQPGAGGGFDKNRFGVRPGELALCNYFRRSAGSPE
jgi:hypothetical protein